MSSIGTQKAQFEFFIGFRSHLTDIFRIFLLAKPELVLMRLPLQHKVTG